VTRLFEHGNGPGALSGAQPPREQDASGNAGAVGPEDPGHLDAGGKEAVQGDGFAHGAGSVLPGGALARTAWKERPILMSAPMVRALLAGTKTQTRRVAKFDPLQPGLNMAFTGLEPHCFGAGWALVSRGEGGCWNERTHPLFCPYGQPGDRLWVREAWMPDPPADGTWAYTAWAGCRESRLSDIPERFRHPAFCNYSASWLHGRVRWTPSIHMPRWASRILLVVTAVRVERLQDISDDDARQEGVAEWAAGALSPEGQETVCRQEGYRMLWESINGAGSWDANPWVWVVEFRRLS
jgi:hypothetical protein